MSRSMLVSRRQVSSAPAVSVEPHSNLEAACSEKGLAGAPDNEAGEEEDEDAEQRDCVVYLLWLGAGI